MKILSLAGIAAGLLCSAAYAQPPSKGAEFIRFNLPLILCDTQEQVRAIYNAGVATPDGGAQAKYMEYFSQPNGRGEPTCMLGGINARYVYENVDLGMMPVSERFEVRAFALHLGNGGAEGWAIYYEPEHDEEWQVDPAYRNRFI